jgi:hypothetical protein
LHRFSIIGMAAACTAALALAPAGARAGTEVTPGFRVGLEERYDDDALLAEAGMGQLMTKLTPQVGLAVRGRTFETGGWYAADLLLHNGSGSFAVDHRGRAMLDVKLSDRAALDGKVDAWRVSDPTSLPRLGVAATLSPVLYGRAEAGAHYQLSERWTAGLGYAFEGAQIYDGRSAPGFAHAPSVDAWYRATRRTDLGLEVRFQQFVFGPESSSATSAALMARHRFTRQVHGSIRGGAGMYSAPGSAPGSTLGAAAAVAQPYPRARLELSREGERVDLALVLGHDLMGASGFTAALWADYGSVVLDWRVLEKLKVYGAASAFRNGRAPDLGYWTLYAPGTSQGYQLAAGLEWQFNGALALKLQGDRYAQIGATAPGTVDLARNVLSVRLVVTPFDWAQGRGW